MYIREIIMVCSRTNLLQKNLLLFMVHLQCNGVAHFWLYGFPIRLRFLHTASLIWKQTKWELSPLYKHWGCCECNLCETGKNFHYLSCMVTDTGRDNQHHKSGIVIHRICKWWPFAIHPRAEYTRLDLNQNQTLLNFSRDVLKKMHVKLSKNETKLQMDYVFNLPIFHVCKCLLFGGINFMRQMFRRDGWWNIDLSV